ncbi:hypothetical protein E8E14_009743 [Neopestalotiopsis sp. 37M]|nr:hypothetical protein E8E14_009743 [Neopestalotiopsis sp. 37M]
MNSSTSVIQSTQEATGQSVFWVLITLAGAAVCQPTSTRMDAVFFGGSISFMRAIPSICLEDGILDMYALCKAARERRTASGRNINSVALPTHTSTNQITARLRPNVVMAKLTIAFLAVLPQTIKIFSMRGIPWTQFAAALYFLAWVVRLFIELIDLKTTRYLPVGELKDLGWKHPISILTNLVVIGQIYSWIWIWYNMGFMVIFDISEFWWLRLTLDLVKCFTALTMLTQILINWRGVVVHWSQAEPAKPQVLSVVGLALLLSVYLLTSPLNEAAPSSIPSMLVKVDGTLNRLKYAMVWILFAASSSITVAGLLDLLGRKIAERHDPQVSHTGSEQAASAVPQASDASLADAAHTLEESDTASRKSLGSKIKVVVMRPIYSVLYNVHVINSGIDDKVKNFICQNSEASNIIAVTIFNLVTTVCYYLVKFDGTGTESPAWTSILG